MPTILLEPHTDCDALTETGSFQIHLPINGPSGANDVVVSVLAPGVPIRPDNVIQTAWNMTTGGNPVQRRYVPGTGWTSWTSAAGGGSGAAGGTSFDDASIQTIAETWPVPLTGSFASFISALGLSGAITDAEGAVNVALAIALYVNSLVVTLTADTTVIHAARPPTNTLGTTFAFTAPDYDVPNTFKVHVGAIWIDTASANLDAYLCVQAFPTSSIWKQLSGTNLT